MKYMLWVHSSDSDEYSHHLFLQLNEIWHTKYA